MNRVAIRDVVLDSTRALAVQGVLPLDLHIDSITDDVEFLAMGMDSSSLVSLFLEVEARLDTRLPLEEASSVRSFGDFCDWIMIRLDEPAAEFSSQPRSGSPKRDSDMLQVVRAAKSLGLVHNYAEDCAADGRRVTINGRELLNFASCSYLGLELDSRVKAGVVDHVSRYGVSFIMSRSYASSPGFLELEQLLGDIFEDNVAVTPSTSLAHLSFVEVFIEDGDLVVLDQEAHNSLRMATKALASRAETIILPHNDLGKLSSIVDRSSGRKVWYLADGVYSMSGDLAPVPELHRLLQEHENFHCYLDDAHGMSVYGPRGCGFVLGHPQRSERLFVAVSLSKAYGIGCGGAVVFRKPEQRWRFQAMGATMIFSSPIPPPMVGAGIASAKIHLAAEFKNIQEELRDRVLAFRDAMKRRGLLERIGASETPIQYGVVGSTRAALEVVQELFSAGCFVSVCGPPAVPEHRSGFRVTITRNQRFEDYDVLADACRRALSRAAPKKLAL